MSLPNELLPVGLLGKGPAGGYQISRSLRFNSADSAYLSRTPSVAGNGKIWTWAGWIKRTNPGNLDIIFSANNSVGLDARISFTSNNTFYYSYDGTSTLETTQIFRDPSAWMHIVFNFDSTNATASERLRLYVNGSRVTTFSTATYPTLNESTNFGLNKAHAIGQFATVSGYYANFYLADVHFIDGQALTPSSFGETDSNGVWQPKAYTGTYGTNGFRLDFSDNSNTTAATLGSDRSGNGNNWTPNNFSVTAGAGNDSLVDSPTNYGTDAGAGGEVRGNYCTLNPLSTNGLTTGNGNLEVTGGTNYRNIAGTFGISSGKWYWECTILTGNEPTIGISDAQGLLYAGWYTRTTYGYGYYTYDGTKFNNDSRTNYGASCASGDIVGVAFDADTRALTFYKNGVSQGVAFTVASGITYYPAFSQYSTTAAFNFGQRPFAYAAPSGFKALCTQNLPTPTIPNGRTAMDVVTYTGNGTARSITGLAFSPDLVWIKDRTSGVAYHALFDSIRGTTIGLAPNTTNAEITDSNSLTSFDSTGFSLGSGSGSWYVNYNNDAFVGWAWDAGTSTVTNTAGTITSQVRANASAGISIVSWTGNTTNGATVGHGLGVAPSLVIYKNRSAATNWIVNATPITGTGTYLILNGTNATASNAQYVLPTSSTLVLPSYSDTNGGSMIAYCFAPVSGFSAFGSYTGNGSADGPFVFCNFSPRWILLKRTDTTGNWYVWDTARDTFNVASKELYPNLSNAEATNADLDILSNGFKIRATTADFNANAGTYIYAAFASNPFTNSRAR